MDHKHIEALRAVLRRARDDDQGGYRLYEGGGRWRFASTSLTVTPDELNALFALAGIEPDVIVPRAPKGGCQTCLHAKVIADPSPAFRAERRVPEGPVRVERGYSGPCLTCKRPGMSNYEPVEV